MAHDVRFLVFSGDEQSASDLRSVLLGFDRVKIVAEIDEPALIVQAVGQFPVDVLLVDLDPTPAAILPIIGEVAATSPDLAIFATSASTDGNLILQALRLGIREFLPKPADPGPLGEAITKVAGQQKESVAHGQIITVLGASGGMGATMFATNLSVELAGCSQKRVTIVDLDYRFGQVATLFDVVPTYTLADLCASPEQLEPQVVERALIKHDSGVRVLSRPSSFAQADTITAASCVGLLATLASMNEYVVVDGPNRFDNNAKSVLDLADVTLLLVQLLVPDIRNAHRIIEGMRDAGCNLGRTKLICNRVGRDCASLTEKDVAETLGLEVFATVPDDWPTVSGAINLGEPLSQHGPKTKVRLALQKIAERLHTLDSPADDGDSGFQKKSGFMGRIFANS